MTHQKSDNKKTKKSYAWDESRLKTTLASLSVCYCVPYLARFKIEFPFLNRLLRTGRIFSLHGCMLAYCCKIELRLLAEALRDRTRSYFG